MSFANTNTNTSNVSTTTNTANDANTNNGITLHAERAERSEAMRCGVVILLITWCDVVVGNVVVGIGNNNDDDVINRKSF
eukprot:CAMPEP_0116043034 /NCGR_PEP_ID=MMETSP0321-20121206/26091_1 /TAXON_ID=163516 /ORGANISM="Leptocylindrus danicus var. danicus, Strain B650" /LENGTH=79 /DNA_ID=CAMNT_0003523717 /DNA_START=1424 /DNA_END=1660 /DNA_ORIENTATION=+